MTLTQQLITCAAAVGATVLTRFLPYILFPEGRKIPDFILYLGKFLAPAVFGLLVVYCFKNVSFTTGTHVIPELVALLTVVVLYLWKRNMVLPMAGGTAVYMILIRIM